MAVHQYRQVNMHWPSWCYDNTWIKLTWCYHHRNWKMMERIKKQEKKKSNFFSDFYSLYSVLTHYNFFHFEINVTFGDQWKVYTSVFYVCWCCRWCTRRWRRGQPYPSRTSPATTSAQAALCSPCRANVGFLWGTGRLGLLGTQPQSTIMDHRIQPVCTSGL